MKNILLFLFGLFCGAQSFAQDPDLYRTWYLHSYGIDLGETSYLSDVQPFLSIDMTIDNQLFFTGLACNEYGGEYNYETTSDLLELTFFDLCLCGTCNNPPQSHVDLENDYFSYYFNMEGQFYDYEIWTDVNTGIMRLRLESIPGYFLEYQNEPVLNISNQNLVEFYIYPNPVSDQLFITSENLQIETIKIYSISGKEVMNFESNEESIDVSSLSEGLYFIEVSSLEGKSIQKFVKE